MSIRIQEPQEISDMSLRVPGRRIAWSLTIMAIGALSALPALADEIVYFVNGKAMMVKKVEKGPEFTILEIEGGGRIGVPNDSHHPYRALSGVGAAPCSLDGPVDRGGGGRHPAEGVDSFTAGFGSPDPGSRTHA
jgi:hypothetical protein